MDEHARYRQTGTFSKPVHVHILYLHQYYCPQGGWGNDRSRAFSEIWCRSGAKVTMLTSTAMFPPEHPAHKQWWYTEHGASTSGLNIKAFNLPHTHPWGTPGRLFLFLVFSIFCLIVGLGCRNIHLVYASSPPLPLPWIGQLLSCWHRCPWVYEVVDLWPEIPIQMGRIPLKRLSRPLLHLTYYTYATADLVVPLSEGMENVIRSTFQERYPRLQCPSIQTVVNGTDPQMFTPPTAFVEQESPEVHHLVYAGTLGMANGLETLLTTGRSLERETHRIIYLDIYGDGNHAAYLRSAIELENLTRIRLFPPVPKAELPAILQRASVGLSTFSPWPLLQTNSANKVFDYLAAGLPVVINYGGWQAAWLQKYGCGFAADSGSDAAFYRLILQLIDQPRLRAEMGKRARKLAVDCCNRQHLASGLLTHFRDL